MTKHPTTPQRTEWPRPAAVSLFSGAGGMDVGLERAGFTVVAANDRDPDCAATLTANHAQGIEIDGRPGYRHGDHCRVLHAPVEDVTGRDLAPSGTSSDWRPDLLVGGPPCQPFSSAGAQRSTSDPRGRLFEHFVRLASELRPRYVLFENVRGLVTARGPSGRPGEALELVKTEFEAIGYATRFALLNAADHGLPQRRVRLFMFGAAQQPLPQFPAPTHCDPRDGVLPLFDRRRPWNALGAVLASRPRPNAADIVRPSEQLELQLADVPTGSGLKSPGRAEPTRPGGHWGYKQGTFIADPNLPARTVTGAATQDWVREPHGRLRRLTLAECAALQSFPDAWRFCGSRSSQFLQVGNAVPCLLAEVLGRAILDALAECVEGTASQSAPLPPELAGAMAYADGDDRRNGSVRPRSPRFRGSAAA